ncbi:MAG: type II toxin-antitoxin system HicA family toxin [Alphaproteobacteria bacterium]
MYNTDAMKRARFVSRLRRYASKNDPEFRWDESRGKGSHGTVYVGNRRTTVKLGELKPGYVRLMLDQLGLLADALT